MPADEIEKILEPKRLVRIAGSIFLAIVLFFALVIGVKMTLNAMNSVEVTSHDHAWFKSQNEEIYALEHRISETKQALADHKEEVGSRWVSRSDDRAQTQKLTSSLMTLQEQYTELVKSYNVAADLASDSVLDKLPRTIEIKTKTEEPPEEDK